MSRVAWVTDPHLDHASPEALETFQGELLEARVTGVIVTGDIAESIGLHAHLLRHGEEKITHVRVAVGRATAKLIVLAGGVQLVAVKVALVEVEVATVLQSTA